MINTFVGPTQQRIPACALRYVALTLVATTTAHLYVCAVVDDPLRGWAFADPRQHHEPIRFENPRRGAFQETCSPTQRDPPALTADEWFAGTHGSLSRHRAATDALVCVCVQAAMRRPLVSSTRPLRRARPPLCRNSPRPRPCRPLPLGQAHLDWLRCRRLGRHQALLTYVVAAVCTCACACV